MLTIPLRKATIHLLQNIGLANIHEDLLRLCQQVLGLLEVHGRRHPLDNLGLLGRLRLPW